jgi:ABC-type spermidine/putrescine transport system permease subunit II
MKPAFPSSKIFHVFPAYFTLADKLGWYGLRLLCAGVLLFLLLPILVIIPLSFSNSSFLAYPIPGWSLRCLLQMTGRAPRATVLSWHRWQR